MSLTDRKEAAPVFYQDAACSASPRFANSRPHYDSYSLPFLYLMKLFQPITIGALLVLGAVQVQVGIARAADTTTVFNEVMYHPATATDSEWIELANVMAVNMDLSGWEITGGVNFTFPEGTVISAGGFLAVAANPTGLATAAKLTGVLGPWVGSLNNGGETLVLRDRTRRIMDEVTYADDNGWPVAADGGGFSLARRTGALSGKLPEHWVASVLQGGTPGVDNFAITIAPPQSLFSLGDAWLYQSASAGLATGWAGASYSAGTGGWLSGNGALAFEEATLPAAIGTVLPTPATHPTGTYYFQKQFSFSGNPASVRLNLQILLDDGAVIYLNGTEVARPRMPSGTVTAASRATNETENAVLENLTIPTAALLNGTNTLSVEAHAAGMAIPNTGGLTLTGMTLSEVGGTLLTPNYARQAGAVTFAKDVLGNGTYAPTYTIPNLTDGVYGNPKSWIGNTLNSFCGVSFGATAVSVGRVAWGRDNTGSTADRTAGLYTLEYTAVANPNAATSTTGNPATGWASIGTASYPANTAPFALRHVFSFTPVLATGIRLNTPGNGLSTGTCIDELEAGPAAAPSAPVFALMATGGQLDLPANLALTGTAFAKDLLTGYSAHTIPHLNDGIYGNPNSWIGGTATSFCAIAFPASRTVGRIAFGRDNTGAFTDRTIGNYTVQFTTVANPTSSTPDVSWTTIGSFTVEGTAIPSPSLRHVYEFAAVSATGLRVLTPNGACIDELEIYAGSDPDIVWGAALDLRAIIPQPIPPSLRISEIAGSTATTWRIEIQNTSATSVNLGGLVLSFTGSTASYTFPASSLAAGDLLVLDQAALGFRPLRNDGVLLKTAGGAALIDAAVVGSTTRARDALGRTLVPTADSFGSTNTFALNTSIVINEVMYHFPPSSSTPTASVTDNPEEWVELYNRSNAAVSLAGWSLDDAVSFTFPSGTSIPANGYLVVARDATALSVKWPEQSSRIVGNFTDSLSNTTDHLVLKDVNGNPAHEMRYYTGGAWPESPDGGGASLELRDPRSDTTIGSAWAASDESSDAAWENVSYTMVAGQKFGQTLWNEFRLGMLDSGECLVDDVSVVRISNSQQLIQGGNFESLTSKWRFLGNHGSSAIETEPGNAGNHVLRVRASGAFSWNHNHIETSFVNNTALVDGQSYTVSFRARWLSGSNQLNTRAYYSRLARTTELGMATRIGTLGTVNSRFVANLGPTLSLLSHTPLIPSANNPVTVSATAVDPDGIGALTLRYAVNGSATFASAAMTSNGATYAASIPGQAAGAIVQFYIEATDSLGASSTLPAAGANSRALYLVNDGAGTSAAAHELRVIMLPADSTNLLAPLNRLSDGRIGGTVIYRRNEVFYDIGVRLQGTTAGRIRDGEDYPGYDVGFPADHLFRGLHSNVNIDRSGRGPVVRQQHEIYVKHIFHRAGVPCTYDDLVYFVAPNSIHTGTAILQMAGYGGEFLDSEFGGDGTIFNMDGTYEPSTTTDGNFESFKNPVPMATQVQSDFTNLGTDKEQYRGQLDPRAGARGDDYSGLIPFCQAMADTGPNYAANLAARMDVDEWMRCAAVYSLLGIADCYMTAGFPHNLRVHVPSAGGKVKALPWDMDFVHDFASNSPAVLAGGNLLRVINTVPGARHAYYRHLHELCQTIYSSTYMTPWLTHYGSVVGQNYTSNAVYIDARRASLLSQLPANVTFAIKTNAGANFTANSASTTLAGNGWIHVSEIRRADTGAALDLTWITATAWTATLALNFGANPITLLAYDSSGSQVGTATINITSTLNIGAVSDFLRITEVLYNPAAPSTAAELAVSADKDDFEFIEVRNSSTNDQIDTTGCKFIAGVDVTLSGVLDALEFGVIVRNVAAFVARYGTGPRIIGTYGPTDFLSNRGETITLVDATGAIIQSFTYGDNWYSQTDGRGYSLISISPILPLDRDAATSWRPSTTIGGNPNTSDAVTFTGNPTADLDADGLSAFLEYTLGTSDITPNANSLSAVTQPDGSLLVSFTSQLNADDVALTLETSSTLTNFTPTPASLVSSTQIGSKLAQSWSIAPPPGTTRWFVRLTATAR